MKNIFGLLFFATILLISCSIKTGTVKGTLCYPSDYIPAMNVYLKNNESSSIYKVTIKEDQKTFEFNEIPEGNYVAYAYTIEETVTDVNKNSSKGSGGFTHAVPCGLTVDCNDHKLIEFKVIRGETTDSISICDWYGAIVPTELTALKVNGLSIKDYFIPDSQFNKATFYTPNNTGERTEITRTIYYVNKGESYDITNAPMFNGNPSAIETKTVVFTQTEVKMNKSVSTTMLETNKKQVYESSRIILKMPPQGQTASWTFQDLSGDNIKCTSSWTTVSVSGQQKKAIKVNKVIVGAENWGKTIEYYVKGIGLWKTEIQGSDGITQTFDEFDGLENDPTAK